jgi:hypothetical protein
MDNAIKKINWWKVATYFGVVIMGAILIGTALGNVRAYAEVYNLPQEFSLQTCVWIIAGAVLSFIGGHIAGSNLLK